MISSNIINNKMDRRKKYHWVKVEKITRLIDLPLDCHQIINEYLDLKSFYRFGGANRQFYWTMKSFDNWKRKIVL